MTLVERREGEALVMWVTSNGYCNFLLAVINDDSAGITNGSSAATFSSRLD